MEMRHLRYFVAVAEELSFTGAALHLHVAQPSLSQQIRDLEREIGAELLARSSRRVALTTAGLAFLDQARAILAQAEDAKRQARSISAGQVGFLDIGLTGSVLLGPLGSVIAAFTQHHPQVAVRLHEMSPRDQQAALRARRTDVTFLRRPDADPDFVVEPAWTEAVALALPETHLLADRRVVALSDLHGEDFVFLRLEDSRFANDLLASCVSAGFLPRIVQQVVEAHSLVSLVAAGLGIALVPASSQSLGRQGVIYRPLSEPAPRADVQMLYRRDCTPVADRFVALARKLLWPTTTLASQDC